MSNRALTVKVTFVSRSGKTSTIKYDSLNSAVAELNAKAGNTPYSYRSANRSQLVALARILGPKRVTVDGYSLSF